MRDPRTSHPVRPIRVRTYRGHARRANRRTKSRRLGMKKADGLAK
jgi:hypothetical protein